jgi:predicted DNA-binding protein
MTIKAGENMKLNKQIIVRMTATEKQDLENIAKDTETTVSRFIRNLIYEYIQQHKKEVIQ